MRTDGLSFNDIPALRTPLGFFLTAPLFGVLAGLLLIVQPTLLQSRWHAATLALTHLIAVGFGGQMMVGALYQVMPVVGGQPIRATAGSAPLVRTLLTLGGLALPLAFLTQHRWLFGLASLTLGGALLLFSVNFGTALWRARPAGETVRVLRLAAIGLLAAAALGAYQALFHSLPGQLEYAPALTTLHLRWASLGWVLLLVMGVSLQVIPMFHVTPAFPRWVGRVLAPALPALLVLDLLLPAGGVMTICACALVMLAYAGTALRLLNQRKRKRLDYTVRFWQLALIHLMVSAVVAGLLVTLESEDLLAPLMGVLFGAGFMVSVMVGMLQKIVPFLIYLHLQRSCLNNPMAIMGLPNMNELLPVSRSRRQWQLHLAMLASLYLSLIPHAPLILASGAGLFAAANFGWLWWSLWQALRCYRNARRDIEASAV